MKFLLLVLLSVSSLGAGNEDVVMKAEALDETQASNQQNFDVVASLKQTLDHELNESTHPLAVGAVALLFGVAMWYEGVQCFELFVIAFISVVFGIVAKQSALSYWEAHNFAHQFSPHIAANVVGIEVGVVAAAACAQGRKGVMVIAGGVAGFWVASVINSLLVAHVSPKFDMVEISFFVYTIVSLPAAYAVFKNQHSGCLALIAPFAGGAFISSAILFFITEAVYNPDCLPNCSPFASPKRGQWVNFFHMAFQHVVSQPTDEDFGIFHNSTMNYKTKNGVVFGDHIFILVVWAALWYAGFKVQMGKARAKEQSPYALSVNGREVLTEGLLQDEA